MSNFLNEKVPRVPPLSRVAIEELATRFLQILAPEALDEPGPLDLMNLTEHILPQHNIYFYPASEAELPEQHGATDPAGTGPINVLMRERPFAELALSGRRANFARSTASHEIGHAVLHVPYLRRVRVLHAASVTLNRTERRRLVAYEDPEWQAWEFAGAILMPARWLRQLIAARRSAAAIGAVFNVSEAFASKRLETLGLAR